MSRKKPPFRAKDAKDLAGLSYRQLNDWGARGAVSGERTDEGGWRRFTLKEIFVLMVCAEIRRLYGIPVEKLLFVRTFMMQEGADHFAAAVDLMKLGLHVFLLTDLSKTFVMDSDLEFTSLMMHGYFRAERTAPFIFLRLNEMVNRLLGVLKEPISLQPNDGVYRLVAEGDASITACTKPEVDLLHAIRSGKFDQIDVDVRDGLIRFIDAKGSVESADLSFQSDSVSIKRTNEFESVEIVTRDGKVVRTRRSLPKKYSEEDNNPILFGAMIRSERERVKRKSTSEPVTASSRAGSPPSNSPPESDREDLSHGNQGAHEAHPRAPDAQPKEMPRDPRR